MAGLDHVAFAVDNVAFGFDGGAFNFDDGTFNLDGNAFNDKGFDFDDDPCHSTLALSVFEVLEVAPLPPTVTAAVP